MAFLKETERSLRAWFILVGVLAVASGLVSLGDATRSSLTGISAIVTLTLWFLPVSRLVLGPGFVVAGVRLKRSLEVGAPRTKQLVLIAAAATVLESVLFVAALNSFGGRQDGAELTGRAFGRAVIPLLILWYIHASLRRLADESRQRFVDTVGNKFS